MGLLEAENLLTGWATVSVSGQTLYHGVSYSIRMLRRRFGRRI